MDEQKKLILDETYGDVLKSALGGPPQKLTVKMIEEWERLYKEKTGQEIGSIHVSVEALKIWIGEDEK